MGSELLTYKTAWAVWAVLFVVIMGVEGDMMRGATCGAGDAHSSGTPDLAFGFCEGSVNKSSIWTRAPSKFTQTFTPPLLTTTEDSAISCVLLCSEVDRYVATIYNDATGACACLDRLVSVPAEPGNQFWLRDYDFDATLDTYTSTQVGITVKFYSVHTVYSVEGGKTECASAGGRLAVLDSEAKFNFIVNLPPYQPGSYYPVGATDSVVEGIFRWSTGRLMLLDHMWVPGNPDNYNGIEDCAEIHNYQYNDMDCVNQRQLICEIL